MIGLSNFIANMPLFFCIFVEFGQVVAHTDTSKAVF